MMSEEHKNPLALANQSGEKNCRLWKSEIIYYRPLFHPHVIPGIKWKLLCSHSLQENYQDQSSFLIPGKDLLSAITRVLSKSR